MFDSPADLPADGWDAVLTALGPASEHIIDAREAVIIADRAPGAVLVQFWGDVRRDALDLLGIRSGLRNSRSPGIWESCSPPLGRTRSSASRPEGCGPVNGCCATEFGSMHAGRNRGATRYRPPGSCPSGRWTKSSMSKPRILLLGYGPTAESALTSLLPRVEVVGVVRKATGGHDPVTDLAARHAIPLTGPAEPKDIAHLLERWRPDGVVISSFDRILRLNANSPPVINIHYAPLPRYRGRASVNWAIINGEPATAITIHRVNNGLKLRTDPFSAEVPITPRDTVTDLYRRLNALQEEHLGDTVVRALAGWEGVPQDEAAATYACARTPEDGAIDGTGPRRTSTGWFVRFGHRFRGLHDVRRTGPAGSSGRAGGQLSNLCGCGARTGRAAFRGGGVGGGADRKRSAAPLGSRAPGRRTGSGRGGDSSDPRNPRIWNGGPDPPPGTTGPRPGFGSGRYGRKRHHEAQGQAYPGDRRRRVHRLAHHRSADGGGLRRDRRGRQLGARRPRQSRRRADIGPVRLIDGDIRDRR